jgi:DNA replication protein DnaC
LNPKLNEILREYGRKRDRAVSDQKKRVEDIYRKIPRIKEIDSEIAKTGVLIAKSLLNDPDSYEENLAEVKDKMSCLKSEKAFLLTEHNIPLEELEVKYECSECKDSGYLKNGRKCSCLKQALIRETYKMSNIESQLFTENFKTFDIEIFSNAPFEEEPFSPRENMLRILNISEEFCLNFDKKNGENLLFYGTTGLGKTFLCNCVAKFLLDKGKVVIYQTAFKIMETVEAHRFKKSGSRSTSDEDYDMLFDADLLIIDDLGTELSNSFTTTEFFNIINSRLLKGNKTIISTNLSPIEIANIYTDRVFSRLLSQFNMLKFYGPDLRWEKK